MLVGVGLLFIVIVGLIAGWATGKIMKGSGYGLLTDIVLGIVGAIMGSRILGWVGIYSNGGLVPDILVAIVGAVILVALARAIRKV
jgi:uncharacterized membrane protein YeaQ/YmgE (transglycosylase-associated protein family)